MKNKFLIYLSERFYPNDAYIKIHNSTAREVVSLDVGLCPLKQKLLSFSDIEKIILLTDEQVIIACVPDYSNTCKFLEKYEFCGYDIVDSDMYTSLLTNLIEERVLKILNKYKFNQYNLLDNLIDANEITKSLTSLEVEHCDSPSVYAIYRITKPLFLS